MRGRTLDNAFIILDEAQNTTPAQMKMFLTRIGFGSKVIVTGDQSQKDLPAGAASGLDTAIHVLKKIDDIGFCYLTSSDVVRHPLVQKIVQAGDEYVRRIKAANDAIPGEVISAKISRMELLVDRIFDRVEQNPDSVNDMRRMMDYYLPTTMKLLEAYKELDAQPVQGENIISSKKEIEDTIDTLNLAFEKLLDSLFQDTAWDVSSDISVLHTMLAQEGLTEDGLKK